MTEPASTAHAASLPPGELTTVRQINVAIEDAALRGRATVHADTAAATQARIIRARNRGGTLQVKLLTTGRWQNASRVYTVG